MAKQKTSNVDSAGSQDYPSLEIAQRWCSDRGEGWQVIDKAGRGGTAPVYGILTPEGERALKIYDEDFSTGERSRLQPERVQLQLKLRGHTCPSLVKIYEGGSFGGRLFVLMSRAPGQELEKVLTEVPRGKIRHIVDQIARAAAFLQKKGICHRDIKSANIFITDDLETVTLLDLSVIRDISDPVGIGTDHGDQLPIVATARYSPPEYLFRLLDPSEALWRLLDTYQLGALLHDLIMRKPMFREEYDQAKENRYRFAYAVATKTPSIDADDVDGDLIFLAKRALTRDWQQRVSLTVEDFFADRGTRQTNALNMLGLGKVQRPKRAKQPSRDYPRLLELAREAEGLVTASLRELGATAQHELRQHDNQSISVELSWPAPGGGDDQPTDTDVNFRFRISILNQDGKLAFSILTRLSGMPNDPDRSAELLIPPIEDRDDVAVAMASSISAAIAELAVKLSSADDKGEG